MPDGLNNIDWDNFLEKAERSKALVEKESNRYLEAKANYKSFDDLYMDAFTKNTISPNNKTVNLQRQLAGNSMTGPNPGKNLPFKQQFSNLSDYVTSDQVMKDDPFKLAKPFDFNGTQYGQFFDRYYNHPKFNKLGFSPYRDNEVFYNAKSTHFDDFMRMGTQWGKLFWDGYSGLFQNWGNFSLAGDLHHAANMEKAMGIAMSSKGGAPAFITNLAGNSAYTFGILGEIFTEEAALFAATALTGGLAGGPAAVKTGTNIGRLTKLLMSIPEALKNVKSLGSIIKNMSSNLGQSRKFYNAFSKGTTGLLKFVNPLEHSVDFLKNAGNLKNIEKLGDMALFSKGLGSFYRDMRGINAAFDESTLEGGMVQNEMTNSLLNDYYKTNGHLPTAGSEDANRIYRIADEAGRKTSLANIPAIIYSNKIVLERGFRPFIKNSKFNIYDVQKLKKWGFSTSVKKGTKELVVKPFRKNIKQLGEKQFWKDAPANIIKGNMRYLNANLSEGLQELYQEGLANGMKNYYQSIYENPQLAGLVSTKLSAWQTGLNSQMSNAGLDVFLSGALMGGLVQGPQKVIFEGLPQLGNQIYNSKIFGPAGAKRRQEVNDLRELEQEYVEKVATSMAFILNADSKLKGQFFGMTELNALKQKNIASLMMKAADEGDKKEGLTLTDEGLAYHLHTLNEAGKLSIFKEQIGSLKNLSDEELEEMIGVSPDGTTGGSVRNRLTKVLKNVDTWEEANKEWDRTFSKAKPRDREGQIALSEAKQNFIFNSYSINRTAQRMGELLNLVNSDKTLANASAMDITVLLKNRATSKQELNTLNMVIQGGAVPFSTPEQKKEAKFAQEKLDSLKVYTDTLEELITAYDKHSKLHSASSVATQEEVDELGTLVDTKKKELFDTFAMYMDTLAKENNEVPIKSNIEDLFEKVLDYHLLDTDHNNYVDTVNILSDPYHYEQYEKMLVEINKEFIKNFKEHLKIGLTNYIKLTKTNNLFKDLLDKGVFLSDEGIDQISKGIMPDFYSVPGIDMDNVDPSKLDTLDALSPLSTDPLIKERYAAAINIIETYELSTGKTLEEKIIHVDEELLKSDTNSLMKAESDTRFTIDFYHLLELDYLKASQSISASELVKKILGTSMFLTPRTRYLLRALQQLVAGTDKVDIVKGLNQPTAFSKDGKLQIDLAYFGSDHKNSKSPFEETVIRALLLLPANRAYTQDDVFKDKIDALFQQVKDWYKVQSSSKLKNLGYSFKYPPYALTDQVAFIAESMMNAKFQVLLSNIKSTETKKSIFQEFIDTIKEAIKEFLKQNNSGDPTILDDVLNIITEKLYTKEQIDSFEVVDANEDLIRMVINDSAKLSLLAPQLFDKLMEYAKAEGFDNFTTFMERSTGDPQIGRIVNEYIAAMPEIILGEESELGMTYEEKTAALQDLGYPIDMIKNMSEEDMDSIIDNEEEYVNPITTSDIEKQRQEKLINDLNSAKTKLNSITGTTAMDKVSKGDIQKEIKSIEEELNSKPPIKIVSTLEDLIVSTPIYGKDQTIFTTTSLDRVVVFVEIDGKRYGFYQSTNGTDGKTKNHWYPFYGKASGWVVKDGGGKDWKYNSEASSELQAKLENAAIRLNSVYGHSKIKDVPHIHDTSETETNQIIGSQIIDAKQNLYNDNIEERNRIKKKTAEEGFKKPFDTTVTPIRTTTTTTTKAGSVGVVEDAEYNDFIDKGKVSEARLNDIANKVKNQEPLSDREKEIFSDKTGEINKIIATKAVEPVRYKVSKKSKKGYTIDIVGTDNHYAEEGITVYYSNKYEAKAKMLELNGPLEKIKRPGTKAVIPGEGILIRIPGAYVRWDKEHKIFRYYTLTGKEITTDKKLSGSIELFSSLFPSTIWNLIPESVHNELIKYITLYLESGGTVDTGFDKKLGLMKDLLNKKFSTTDSNKDTDIGFWFTDLKEGNTISDYAHNNDFEGFLPADENADWQYTDRRSSEIEGIIVDLINTYNEGITQYDIDKYIRDNDVNRKSLDIMDAVKYKYGLSIVALLQGPEKQEYTDTALISSLEGGIVYASPGAGKTRLAKMYPELVIDGDIIMAEIFEDWVNKHNIEGAPRKIIDPEFIANDIINYFDKAPSSAMDVFYDIVMARFVDVMSLPENSKKILLTGTSRFVKHPTTGHTDFNLTHIITTTNDTSLTNAIYNKTVKREKETAEAYEDRRNKEVLKALYSTRNRESHARRSGTITYEIDMSNNRVSLENILLGINKPLTSKEITDRLYDDFISDIEYIRTLKNDVIIIKEKNLLLKAFTEHKHRLSLTEVTDLTEKINDLMKAPEKPDGPMPSNLSTDINTPVNPGDISTKPKDERRSDDELDNELDDIDPCNPIK